MRAPGTAPSAASAAATEATRGQPLGYEAFTGWQQDRAGDPPPYGPMRETSGIGRLRPAGLVAALAALVLLLVADAAGAAEVTGYGELARFGETGTTGGQEPLGATGKLDEVRTRAIGVDPTDNSVYILDEPQEPVGAKRTIRLQKFTDPSGTGSYTFVAAATFAVKAPEVLGAEPTVEGLAIDSAEKRVYMLQVDARERKLTQASEVGGGEGVLVAARVLAYSTVEKGEQLVPATGTKTEGTLEGVVVGPGEKELNPQSVKPGEALLGPHGITVDPETHELIILAHVDEAAGKVDEVGSKTDHYVLQRIHANGTLGERYADKTDVLKELDAEGKRPAVTSPAISTVAGKERLFVERAGVVEVPYEFSSSAAPKALAPAANKQEAVEEGISAGAEEGGRLTAAPGPEGELYGANTAAIKATPLAEGLAGIVAFSPASGAVIGWAGGRAVSGGEFKCAITDRIFSMPAVIAAGKEGKVFVLANEYLLRQTVIEEIENPPESGNFEPVFGPLPPPFFPAVIEFGPGGSGCPLASATSPTARVSGIEVKGEESVPKGAEVTFSSRMSFADALKVEWDFGDGAKKTVEGFEYPNTSVTHKFETEGSFTITEKIYSDDLSSPAQPIYKEGHLTSPTITVTRTLNVGRRPPTASFTESKGIAVVGEEVVFANHSTDPNGAEGLPLTYEWSFGDGAASSATSPSHAYASAGKYTVKLTVSDKFGLKASISHEVTVNAPPPPPPPQRASSTTPSAPPPSSGALPYKVMLAATSVPVSPKGALSLKIDCAGESSCTGTVTLRTASAVIASKRKAILTLASATFRIAGQHVQLVSLHLSAKARALLKRLHTLRARATIVARDAGGTSHTTLLLVTLRASKHH